jgi:hypothetical protein
MGCRIHIGPVGTNRGIGFSVAKEPENQEEWIALLEEILRAMKAPDQPDFDVLGKFSPPNPIDL